MPLCFRYYSIHCLTFLAISIPPPPPPPAAAAAALSLRRVTTMTRSMTSSRNNSFGGNGTTSTTSGRSPVQKQDPYLPTMIVFDLDDCLWTPEMHELPGHPSIPIRGDLGNGQEGVVGMQVAGRKNSRERTTTVRLYEGARQALYRLATDPVYRDIVLAAASTSLEPSYSQACLQGLEILPHLTVDQMLSYKQIGRTGRLSSDKRTHFELLHAESGIPYDEMLYFDDDNWANHTDRIRRAFGVVGQRTPTGLTLAEFEQGLALYRQQAQKWVRATNA